MPAPTDLQALKNMQTFLRANGEPIFAEKDKSGNYIPEKFYHSGFIGTSTPEYMTNKGADFAWTPDIESADTKAFFVTKDKKFANQHLARYFNDSVSGLPPPIEVITNASKVWEFNNRDHVNAIMDAVNEADLSRFSSYKKNEKLKSEKQKLEEQTLKEQNLEQVKSGDWRLIEYALDKIKDLGFDAFLIEEMGQINVGILDPRNVKLIKDESVVDQFSRFKREGKVLGTFDPNNPDIRYMPASEAGAGKGKPQPANRITRQAPAMPGNRFMAPAVSAGAKSAERFR
jgi:hypothetical protein